MLRFPHPLNIFERKQLGSKQVLSLFGVMMLFWALFDGTIAYLTPLAITEQGISNTLMGIIIGSSSVAGAFFDFILCRFFTNTYYKRLFIWMFSVCLVVPFVLYQANSFFLFILAMALWGIYYDFKGIGIFSFVGRDTDFEKHAENFSVIQIFLSVGYLIAPLFVGFFVAETLDWKPFALGWIFIVISLFFFLVLLFATSRQNKLTNKSHAQENCLKRNFSQEIFLWRGIGKMLFPVLMCTFLITIIDAFFWTLGPLIAEEMTSLLGHFSGLFMAIYVLPAILSIFIVGRFSSYLGKKRTALIALFLSAGMLLFFPFAGYSFWILPTVFCVALGAFTALPLINGSFGDYIAETEKYEKEIEGLVDFYTNLGFIVGPMLAGFLSDQIGNLQTFSFLGFVVATFALILMLFMPKSIIIKEHLLKIT